MPVAPTLSGYKAVAKLYNALMTGLVLTLVTRKSEDAAARFVFGHFRRQHLEKFLPGLKKLGLDGMTDAVACAQYHYFSNALGGVKTADVVVANPTHISVALRYSDKDPAPIVVAKGHDDLAMQIRAEARKLGWSSTMRTVGDT